MNTTTPRVFIAATRQNDGKTTTSLGLLAALQKHYPRVGYIKPVGQRLVEIAEQKIDEDTVLMDQVYKLNCPLVEMSPIPIEPTPWSGRYRRLSIGWRGKRILSCARAPGTLEWDRFSTSPMRVLQKYWVQK
jgi:hypothetical protein